MGGPSSRKTGAIEHNEGSYHAESGGVASWPGSLDPLKNRTLGLPLEVGWEEGWRLPGTQVGGRPGTGTSKTQFSGRAPPTSEPPPETRVDNVPSTANIKAAGGSFSQGSGALARMDTATAAQLQQSGATALSVKISPEKNKASLQLDLSKVKAASGKVKAPSSVSPDKQSSDGAGGGGAGGSPGKGALQPNQKPLPQQSLATMTNLLPPRPLGGRNMNMGAPGNNYNPDPKNNKSEGPPSPTSLQSDSSGGSRPGSGSGNRQIRADKVKTAPRGIPLPRPAGLSAGGAQPMRPGSGGSDGRPASDGSSRSSGRSGISRDEAKSLNASKGLKLASFRAGDNGGEGETEYGYDMGVVGTIDPLATRKGPSAQNTGGLPSGGNMGMGTSPSLGAHRVEDQGWLLHLPEPLMQCSGL